MVDVTDYLISQAGFRVDYGWTGSDEISLLVNRNDQTFGRKERKIVSTLAGAASAAFTAMSCRLNDSRVSTIGSFDARVAQLPNAQRVVDYFRWRQADAQRNAINAHAYWALRRAGLNASQATRQLVGLSVATKLSLLGTFGVDFMQDVPVWHKNGVGLRWEMVDHTGHNPKTKQDVTTKRRRLCANYDLPDGAAYDAYVRERLL
jgi:tRNA(His) 5'-end guanylyltransferase